MDRLCDVTATWKERASDVRGQALPGGHWLPEPLPNEVYAELPNFRPQRNEYLPADAPGKM
jgi:haloacetate dehalogenase